MKELHSTCYLLNPLLLGVQSIGDMHRFLWLPSLGFLNSNSCWNLFEKNNMWSYFVYKFFLVFQRYLQSILWDYICNLTFSFVWSNTLLSYMDCKPVFVKLDEIVLISCQDCFVYICFKNFFEIPFALKFRINFS